jgi:hypothetical protein
MEHHADFAAPMSHQIWMRTRVNRRKGPGHIEGWAIAFGWWVDANVNADGTPGEPVGTLYLIVDQEDPGPPVWIAEGNILETRWMA